MNFPRGSWRIAAGLAHIVLLLKTEHGKLVKEIKCIISSLHFSKEEDGRNTVQCPCMIVEIRLLQASHKKWSLAHGDKHSWSQWSVTWTANISTTSLLQPGSCCFVFLLTLLCSYINFVSQLFNQIKFDNTIKTLLFIL